MAQLGGALRRAWLQPWLLWLLVVIFAADSLVANLAATTHYDAIHLLRAGWNLIHDPRSLYTASVTALIQGRFPEHGLLGPPAEAALAAPFALLPSSAAMAAWVWLDAAAAFAGLLLLERTLRPRGFARPLYWLIAVYFPPLFADFNAGQVGGYLLLLSCLGLVWMQARPRMAGVAAGVGAAIKFYPGALLLGARHRWARFGSGFIPAFVLISMLAFIPLGFPGVGSYLGRVFIPSLNASHFDCAINPVSSLFGRLLGGDSWAQITNAGVISHQLPWHLTIPAAVLTDATLLVVVAAAIWAAARSRWHPLFSAGAGLALGALIPGELYPYQFLPLLPLILVSTMRFIAAGRNRRALLMGVGLLGFLQQPCGLVFPNLWTLAALWLFAVGLSAALLFGLGQGEDGHSANISDQQHIRGQ